LGLRSEPKLGNQDCAGGGAKICENRAQTRGR